MERKWLELPTMGEAFCISKKDLFYYITRSAYAGAQRYSSSWTGDNVATWEHLWIANIQVQKNVNFGMGFTGSDIGGFAEQPSGELYTRWIQLGVFHPLQNTFLRRSWKEPWVFDEEVIDITRKFVNLRYNYYLIYTPCFGSISKKEFPCLNP
jgi:alpha-glucosidase